MLNRFITRFVALVAITGCASACALGAHAPAPIPVSQMLPTTIALAAEFHGARIGADHLRGELQAD